MALSAISCWKRNGRDTVDWLRKASHISSTSTARSTGCQRLPSGARHGLMRGVLSAPHPEQVMPEIIVSGHSQLSLENSQLSTVFRTLDGDGHLSPQPAQRRRSRDAVGRRNAPRLDHNMVPVLRRAPTQEMRAPAVRGAGCRLLKMGVCEVPGPAGLIGVGLTVHISESFTLRHQTSPDSSVEISWRP